MPIFKCDNHKLEDVLIELHALVVKYGGNISDHVTVSETQDELSILSSLPKNNNDELIVLPDACLPRVEDFMIFAIGDELMAKPKPDVKESHIEAMRLMMEIYNITKKLTRQRETNPWLALEKSPDVMSQLYKTRIGETKADRYYERYKKGEFKQLLIDTFIGSRTLALYSGGVEKPSPCLMPFIDFLNHYYASSGYQTSNGKIHSLSIRNSIPIPESNECFVQYAFMDAMDSFLVYGFVDINAPFIRSVPLSFDLNEYSKIQVYGQAPRILKDDLPSSLEDLRAYIPTILEKNDSVMQLSHIIIPGEFAPLALRRVLGLYIRSWKPGLQQNTVYNLIVNAEKMIVQENHKYYANILSAIKNIDSKYISRTIKHSIITLAETQISKLRNYQERIRTLV